MTKKDKRLNALFSEPPPKDFTWLSLIAVLTHAGFSNECNGGSHYLFEHTSGMRLRLSKTHPTGLLKRYQIEDTKEVLIKVGAWVK